MKLQLILLSTDLAPWLKHFIEWLKTNYEWLALSIAILFLINYFWVKSRYEHIQCTAFISRKDNKTENKDVFLKKVDVRIHKKRRTYEYHDRNGKWYPLRTMHIKQIEDSIDKGIPEFDIPKRKQRKIA